MRNWSRASTCCAPLRRRGWRIGRPHWWAAWRGMGRRVWRQSPASRWIDAARGRQPGGQTVGHRIHLFWGPCRGARISKDPSVTWLGFAARSRPDPARQLATFVEVSCEKGAFNITRRGATSSTRVKCSKVHADQASPQAARGWRPRWKRGAECRTGSPQSDVRNLAPSRDHCGGDRQRISSLRELIASRRHGRWWMRARPWLGVRFQPRTLRHLQHAGGSLAGLPANEAHAGGGHLRGDGECRPRHRPREPGRVTGRGQASRSAAAQRRRLSRYPIISG